MLVVGESIRWDWMIIRSWNLGTWMTKRKMKWSHSSSRSFGLSDIKYNGLEFKILSIRVSCVENFSYVKITLLIVRFEWCLYFWPQLSINHQSSDCTEEWNAKSYLVWKKSKECYFDFSVKIHLAFVIHSMHLWRLSH